MKINKQYLVLFLFGMLYCISTIVLFPSYSIPFSIVVMFSLFLLVLLSPEKNVYNSYIFKKPHFLLFFAIPCVLVSNSVSEFYGEKIIVFIGFFTFMACFGQIGAKAFDGVNRSGE